MSFSRLSPSGPQFFHTWMSLGFAKDILSSDVANPYQMLVPGSNLSNLIATEACRVSGLLLSVAPSSAGTGELLFKLFANPAPATPFEVVYQSPPIILPALVYSLFVPFGGSLRLGAGQVVEPSIEVVTQTNVTVKVYASLALEFFK